MSFHAKKVNPEVQAQVEPLVSGIMKDIDSKITRIKKLDKKLKGYTEFGLIVYALEKLEESLKDKEEQL